MPPDVTSAPIFLEDVDSPKTGLDKTPLPPREYKLIPKTIAFHLYVNLAGLYGIYLVLTGHVMYQTVLFGILNFIISILGVSAGAHRLWSHRSYKAKWPLRFLLVFMQSVAYQESVFRWARDHRLHHKYPDDDADPYNPKRGFVYAHCGWQMVKRHPRCVEKGKKMDLSDLISDRIVNFQKTHYNKVAIPLGIILPTLIPMYFWGDSFTSSWHANIVRFFFASHITLFVNSIAHFVGYKPYDKRIGPSDNDWINIISLGEGIHNYHHVFPWDYRSVEMNTFYFNMTTYFIDIMAKIGWAYDLKEATPTMVQNRVSKTGDESTRRKNIYSN